MDRMFDEFANLWMKMKIQVKTKEDLDSKQYIFRPRAFDIKDVIEMDVSTLESSIANEAFSEWKELASEEVSVESEKVCMLFRFNLGWTCNMIGLLLRDYDGKVTHEEMASAAIYLKDTLGKEGVQELITNLSKDKDHPRYFTTCKNLLQNRMHLIPKDKVPFIWQPNKAQIPIPSKSTPHPNNFVFIPDNLTCFGMCITRLREMVARDEFGRRRNKAATIVQSYGEFGDDRRVSSPWISEYDQPSRADEVDNWAVTKKPMMPTYDEISRDEEIDNWTASKEPMPLTRSSNSGPGFRDSGGSEDDHWK
ncbi:unnamed protein product [Lactuca saligna]|uniref:Uncharacterized protein n=1 Tax=Lactuca saligna TaxID=75948 RepID=A0AA35Z8N3_LACSI|nr:unnamed protein product [Lactuca saligna]